MSKSLAETFINIVQEDDARAAAAEEAHIKAEVARLRKECDTLLKDIKRNLDDITDRRDQYVLEGLRNSLYILRRNWN